jgi:hypothetical protein
VYGREIANTDMYWSPTKLANTFGNLVRAVMQKYRKSTDNCGSKYSILAELRLIKHSCIFFSLQYVKKVESATD